MQLPTPTPQFVFFANMPQCKRTYKRYLENKIRDNWDFSGVPIDIYIREIVIENLDASRDFCSYN
jgi:GTP-binding protein